jgi:hypothetical protein
VYDRRNHRGTGEGTGRSQRTNRSLEKYKTALNVALQARLDLNGFISARPQVYSPQTVTLTALTEGKDSPNARPNSLEMARVVLLNLDGEEKTPDEIRALIKKTYGIGPA